MAAPLNIGMPDNIDIGDGYTLRVTGIDPATGNATAGVKTSQVIFEVDALGASVSDLAIGPFMIVPGPGA